MKQPDPARREAAASRARLRGSSVMVALMLIGSVFIAAPGQPARAEADSSCTATHWIAAWSAAPSDATPLISPDLRPALVTGGQTFRMIVTPHRDGSLLRVHLTNRFGDQPVTFAHVTVGPAGAGAALATGSVPSVTFGGATSVDVEAGADILSDPIPLTVSAFQRVAISFFVPGTVVVPTEHLNANQTSYYTPPNNMDLSASVPGDAFTLSTTSWYWVSGLDVQAPAGASTLVAFGDSITDGFVGQSPLPVPAGTEQVDQDVRYPDFLQRRLSASDIPLTAVNAGISGNLLLRPGLIPHYGPAAVSRVLRDVAEIPGVTNAIIAIGTNDLGDALEPATADQLAQGYTGLVNALHERGIHVLIGTILPSGNAILGGPATAPGLEESRQRINTWIRTQDIADGIVDFDLAMRSPDDPSVLNPAYASADNLHPNPAGYQAMAAAVPLESLWTPCRH